MKIDSEEKCVEITDVTKVEGDVTVSQRKGKLRHNFDLNITFNWEGSDQEKGLVEIRDFMSDTDKMGFEFYVKPRDSSKVTDDTKKFIMATLRESVWETLQAFASDLIDEQGKHLIVSSDEPSGTTDKKLKEINEAFKKGSLEGSTSSSITDFASWKETVEFQAPASEVFKTLTNRDRAMVWSRSPVEGHLDKKDATFKLLGGAISGKITDINPEKYKLTMEWRLSGWPSNIKSVVNINVQDMGTASKLSLEQVGIPHSEFESTSTNWANYYWNPMKATFGFGAFPKY